jgi:hypothetical protein
MKITRKLLYVIISALISVGPGFSMPEQYWISFTGFVPSTNMPGPQGPIFVVKIDALGNVLVPAHPIEEPHFYHNPGTGPTILDDGHFLHLWVTSGTCGFKHYYCYRFGDNCRDA